MESTDREMAKRLMAEAPIQADTKDTDLPRLFEMLDCKSRAMLWHLWLYGHATVAELRRVGGVTTDFDVLLRLAKAINGKSQEIWGRPVAGFEPVKTDMLTGERFYFNWWFLDHAWAGGAQRQLVDVFDGEDTVTVIAQLPPGADCSGVSKASVIGVACKNGILKVTLRKDRARGKNGH